MLQLRNLNLHRTFCSPSPSVLAFNRTKKTSAFQIAATQQFIDSRKRAIIEMPVIKETIELTEVEQGLFSDLLAAVKEVSYLFNMPQTPL